MNNSTLFIRNMVCDRCKLVVRQELERLGLEPLSIELGEVTLKRPLEESKKEELREVLIRVGFELIDDQRSRLISRVKKLIIELVHHGQAQKVKVNYSVYIEKQVGKDYAYLSKLFSEVEGTTIEQYLIHQKVERAKELLVYGERNISEIANELGYSSVAHLSNQFKKVTGLSPSHFRSIGLKKRTPLDKV